MLHDCCHRLLPNLPFAVLPGLPEQHSSCIRSVPLPWCQRTRLCSVCLSFFIEASLLSCLWQPPFANVLCLEALASIPVAQIGVSSRRSMRCYSDQHALTVMSVSLHADRVIQLSPAIPCKPRLASLDGGAVAGLSSRRDRQVRSRQLATPVLRESCSHPAVTVCCVVGS